MATIISFTGKTEKEISTETIQAKVFEYEVSEEDLYKIADNQPEEYKPN